MAKIKFTRISGHLHLTSVSVSVLLGCSLMSTRWYVRSVLGNNKYMLDYTPHTLHLTLASSSSPSESCQWRQSSSTDLPWVVAYQSYNTTYIKVHIVWMWIMHYTYRIIIAMGNHLPTIPLYSYSKYTYHLISLLSPWLTSLWPPPANNEQIYQHTLYSIVLKLN